MAGAPGGGDTGLERRGYEATSATEMPRNLQEVINIAKIMAASGFYPDAKGPQQAAAIMLLGLQFGIPPAQALSSVHIVKGKPSLHYSAQLSKVRQHPDYDYRIEMDTNERCEIVFLRKMKDGKWGEEGRSVFTLADAKRQETQNMGKFPDTMLLARAVSKGIRRFCPDVLNGMPAYSHEEIAGGVADEDAFVALPGQSKAKALVAELTAARAVEADAEGSEELVEASFVESEEGSLPFDDPAEPEADASGSE